MLDNPHCVHVFGQSIYHTKILRLYYTRSPPGGATSRSTDGGSTGSDLDMTPPSPCSSPSTTSSSVTSHTHILHKTFHISHPVAPSDVRINGDQAALFPNLYMDEVMSRVRRWIVMKGELDVHAV